ncbi:uncharacterized protein LOC128127684 [Lactuca sativa]|uniref:uncharacterized protein LOC128127684 n=1 Tax=Lactuca sativa TaxID=4236 RepID=UPI0022AF8CAE|nr:uncharacterized protein LOC128127684 [Lactuca sativa]
MAIHEMGNGYSMKVTNSSRGKVFMLVMTDYFSKWIEVEAFVQVRDKEAVSFIKHNILTRFGIPAEIICRSQFISKMIRDFCTSWGIKIITSTPIHPQANGQTESNNKIIVNNLKKRLDKKMEDEKKSFLSSYGQIGLLLK